VPKVALAKVRMAIHSHYGGHTRPPEYHGAVSSIIMF